MSARYVAVIVGAVILAILLLGLLGGAMMMGWGPMGPGMMGWGGYGFNPVGWIGMALFWGLIVAGIVLLAIWLFRQAGPVTTSSGGTPRALDILKERYARGEITREQYVQMRHDLEGSSSRSE